MPICQHCRSNFEISPFEDSLRNEIAPIVGGLKFPLPASKLCPLCRHRQRIAFRNERNLYRTTCAVTNKSIVSSYSPDKLYKVILRPAWLEHDNTQVGRDYDFSRSFFEQYSDLCRHTYKANVAQAGEIINSDYTHSVGWLKDCYLIFDSGKDEECAYGSFLAYSKNCFDITFGFYSELCYDCVKIENCYALFSSDYCKSCSHSALLNNCIGCKYSLACVNLRNQDYCVLNEHVGKEKFEKIWEEFFRGKNTKLKEQYQALLKESPRRATYNIDSLECTGDTLINCQNVQGSSEVLGAKDCCNIFDIFKNSEKSLDVTGFGEGMDYCYQTTQCGGALGKSAVSNIFFSVNIYYGGYNILYSMNCHENCQNLFGCSELRKKQYCILNKQYTKDDYEALAPKIIEHMRGNDEWGEFFPYSLSPYGYNESLANEEFPISKEEVKRLGANWSDYTPPMPNVSKSILASELQAEDLNEEVLKVAILCQESGRPFKLIPQELEFLKRFNLAPPRKHPELRERDRRLRKNGRSLFRTKCSGCKIEIEAVLRPTHSGPVLCEKCYENTVY